MKLDKYLVLILIAASLILLNAGLSLAQEGATSTQASTVEQIPAPSEPEIQWLWGEVASVDITNKTLLVKYLDYETDSEKEMTINIDDKTTYENVKAIEEIKPLDTVSIDYIVDAEGKNIAKNISVEKPEGNTEIQEEKTGQEEIIEPIPEAPEAEE
jgi:hypothetical protein